MRSEVERLRRIAHRSGTAPAFETEVSGILKRLEIEGGALVLDGDDGTRYELLLPPGWAVEPETGARVTVRGWLERDVVTTAMVGPVLRVSGISRRR